MIDIIKLFSFFIRNSAGSITASLLITGADFDSIPSSAVAIAEEWDIYNRKLGLAGVWGTMLRQWLDMVLPKDVEEDSLRNLHIALTPTLKPSKLVSGIIERSDLIDAIMASCHVPVFLDGRPFTEYKGEQVVDGSFWYFITKNRFSGLPMLDGISRDGIYWVDYVDDEDFLQSISGNFLELIKPDDMYNMIEAGYNFMKREHSKGRLPMPKRSLSYSRSSLLSSRTLRSIPTTIGYNLASSLYSIAPMMTSGRIIRT